jgi:hypothetical protein
VISLPGLMLGRKDLTMSADFWRVPYSRPYDSGLTVIDNKCTVLHTVRFSSTLYGQQTHAELIWLDIFGNFTKQLLISPYS